MSGAIKVLEGGTVTSPQGFLAGDVRRPEDLR